MSPGPLSIRPARASDREVLGALAASLVELHHALDPRRFLAPGPGVADGYGRWLVREAADAEAVVLVAEEEGVVVGYVYARSEPRNYNDLIDAHGKLHDIVVAESARRRGVAQALIEAAAERLAALGCPRIVLSTASGNLAAQGLFGRAGFRPTMIEMTRELAPGGKA